MADRGVVQLAAADAEAALAAGEAAAAVSAAILAVAVADRIALRRLIPVCFPELVFNMFVPTWVIIHRLALSVTCALLLRRHDSRSTRDSY